ncbi:MAG: NAD(P)H-dependent oxidoreductase [Roseofilum sp. Belize BBD 4]|uniref:NADPH-dependent FMN reductase n=1 Tax=Roseofilum sp. Belize BBD 4 TaxID=2821500 RepID=UPI001B29C079|nr:NAD(P)H-dependent oxidoreductase [Roseofilum sp. Belize BBD 4]MBP0035986.1 NAD(P)H-dependent oxidoreductase [Roseofilum sp. Belize BBD 4]
MSNSTKILAFAGSTRQESFHKKLVKIAAQGATDAGAEVTFIDLRDYPMPIYDQDLQEQEGFPESVLALKQLFKSHDGLLIASPEYNSSISGLLKNTIDWLSRSEPDEFPLALSCFRGKVAAIMNTSPGGLGGLRGLVHLRAILENIGVMVLPDQKTIPNAFEQFDSQGQLKEQRQQESVQALGKKLAELAMKLQ